MEQYLTYPHEGYLQDRIAEFCRPYLKLAQSGRNPKDLASNFMWSCTILNGLIQKVSLVIKDPHDWP
jgi:NADP-dependent alcohol dehydrogenase